MGRILYKDCKKDFYERVAPNASSEYEAANMYLPDVDEEASEEGERLNALLPLLTWCAEKGEISEELGDELWFYYNDLASGVLDDIIAPDEREEVEKDLKEAYHKIFNEDEE